MSKCPRCARLCSLYNVYIYVMVNTSRSILIFCLIVFVHDMQRTEILTVRLDRLRLYVCVYRFPIDGNVLYVSHATHDDHPTEFVLFN